MPVTHALLPTGFTHLYAVTRLYARLLRLHYGYHVGPRWFYIPRLGYAFYGSPIRYRFCAALLLPLPHAHARGLRLPFAISFYRVPRSYHTVGSPRTARTFLRTPRSWLVRTFTRFCRLRTFTRGSRFITLFGSAFPFPRSYTVAAFRLRGCHTFCVCSYAYTPRTVLVVFVGYGSWFWFRYHWFAVLIGGLLPLPPACHMRLRLPHRAT